jgi:prephenate dehydratase
VTGDLKPVPERRPRVAYQGEPGAYSEDALHTFFGEADPEPSASIRAVFEQVEIGSVDYGVVPLENSQAGSINETYNLLLRHGVKMVGQVVVSVDHALLAIPGTELKDVRRVYSHPQALAQCEEFLSQLQVEAVPALDTAGAAKQIADEGRGDQAAVAGRRAAELYGLAVLAEGIQTYPQNYTKFGVIGEASPRFGAPDTTSIVFAVSDVPGSLLACLHPFADRGINLHKIESRPQAARPWRYSIYLDFQAAADDPEAVEALAEMAEHTSFVRVLGTYRAWQD